MKVVFMASPGFDYLSNQLMEGLHLLSKDGEVEFICTYKTVHHGAMIEDLEVVSEEEAVHHIDDATWVLFCSGGDFGFRDGVRGEVFNNRKLKEKKVFIDGHDSNGYLCNPNDVHVYIKRELRYPEMCSMVYPNVRSLLFGVYQFLLDHSTMPEGDWDCRDIDITFLAYAGSNAMRKECEYVLKQINGQSIFKGGRPLVVRVDADNNGQPVSIEEYRKAMRETKVGVSVVGAGIDTLRFWETMAHGAVLCSTDITRSMFIRDMPEPHRHALYFDSWNRMVELCRLIVSNKARWLRMRRATDQLLKCHSTRARARQLLTLCAELV
ncbi:MAG: glycosyltransferase [Candidatus Thorarchaeota archaeon]|jgi:hypothetical protein